MIRKETRIINDKSIELFFDTDRQAYQVAKDAMEVFLDNMQTLKDYEDLEAQRKLVSVPCKVGDFVYKLDLRSGKITTHQVAVIDCKILQNTFAIEIIFGIAGSCRGSDFGKTVFLNKTEAIAIWNMKEDKQ